MWAICLDEIEFLDVIHHRILNTHLRSAAGKLCFKFTTMPYFHHTLETNAHAKLKHGDDFEYIYLDQDPIWRGTDRNTLDVLGGKRDRQAHPLCGYQD